MYSISAHKIHGLKGIGALYVKKGVSLKPYLFGGGQENGMRSGTENLPMICAFEEAVRVNQENLMKTILKNHNLWKTSNQNSLVNCLKPF